MQQSPLNQSLHIELDKIPSMPYVLLQLLEVIRDPDVSFTEITEIIQADPALTTRVMSIANSAAYYQWDQNKDFNRLLVALGLKMVKTIAINSAVQQFFSQFNVDNEGMLARFWQTSLTTASIARALAHLTGYHHEDEAYIAGLLHKLGELACLMHNADEYIQKINAVQAASLYELESQRSRIEQDFIGASIPEIGAWIINDFDKDSILSDAVLYQRESAEQIMGTPHLVQVINLAHKLAMLSEPAVVESQTSTFVLENKESVFEEVSRVFGLNQPLLEEMLARSHSEFLDTAKKMGIKISAENSVELDNEQIQLALAENVRTIALSSSLQQINGCRLERRPEKELIEQIMQNLKVLFALSNCLFLAYDDETRQLKGRYGTNRQARLLTHFNISLDASVTLPVQALLKGIPVSSKDSLQNSLQEEAEQDKKSVLDRQLLRLMDAQEMLCIPLFDKLNNKKFGVLVAGISAVRLQAIRREKGLLYEFSKAASEVISQDRVMAEQLRAAVEEEKSLQSLQIRKLVHEANNPLGVIRNYLQILSLKLADSQDSKLQGQLEILMEEVERVGNIVLRIRETPQKKEADNNKVDINELINQLILIFKESLFLKSGIVAHLNLDSSIPLIKSNANSLKQILTNLFKNSAEAMPDGGEINISTRDQVNFNGEQFIELRISDNGPGIPKEILNNLFKPVKSTKSGEHSGLGLSIIKNLVNDLGGTIGGSNRYSLQPSSVSIKQESKGAEFIILLPRRLFTK
ncbi:MAG: HDOD domain-containing protein [Gammaproteobacteria bacterium]|nr:HDOD domain-containing protein [Gammaproteobacteria bacterium]